MKKTPWDLPSLPGPMQIHKNEMIMPFGKYAGIPVKDIPLGYLRWLRENQEIFVAHRSKSWWNELTWNFILGKESNERYKELAECEYSPLPPMEDFGKIENPPW